MGFGEDLLIGGTVGFGAYEFFRHYLFGDGLGSGYDGPPDYSGSHGGLEDDSPCG
jgi:hypothetical protein